MEFPIPSKRASSSSANNGSSNIGGLGVAHRGYVYQDLVTAYLLMVSLVHGKQSVVVDKKIVADDRFDDVEVNVSGSRVRRQIKSSENANRPLSFSDFSSNAVSLRIDRLVATFLAEGTGHANEYRLCATWSAPEVSDQILPLLVPANAPDSL